VFISYRRDDSSGYTGRLFDILTAQFGRENTYMDLDTIEGGDDFTAVIEDKINVSDVLVAVIGNRWLTITGEDGTRRLDNTHDFVRLEIAKALERGIRVIPVIVGGATMPQADDLPEDLRPLCERQAVEIRDSHFHSDAQQLIDVLHRHLQDLGVGPRNVKLKRFAPAVLSCIIVILVAAGIFLIQHKTPEQVGPTATRPNQNTAVHADGTKNSATSQVDVAGKWDALVKYDWGDSYKELFEFEVDGNEVSGTAGFLGDRGAGRVILDGKLAGNRISFTTKSLVTSGIKGETSEDKHYYKGAVLGDAIEFTMVTDSSVSTHAPIHFTANKVKNGPPH